MFADFVNQYGATILYAVLVGVFGYLGVQAKNLCDKYLNSKEKRKIASDCVSFVEQVYKDLHGDEKLQVALETASEMLEKKGITYTELEMRVLIEASLAAFNNAFENTDIPELEPVDDYCGEDEEVED